jgi:hypothetical protein
MIMSINPNDVLFGRGTGPNRNPGNISYLRLVKTQKADYAAAETKEQRDGIALKIVRKVQAMNPPGRFLQRQAKQTESSDARGWEEVDEATALQKTRQALREKEKKHGMKYADSNDKVSTNDTKRKASIVVMDPDEHPPQWGPDINCNDVLLGCGAGPRKHSGNIQFH